MKYNFKVGRKYKRTYLIKTDRKEPPYTFTVLEISDNIRIKISAIPADSSRSRYEDWYPIGFWDNEPDGSIKLLNSSLIEEQFKAFLES